MSTSITVVDSTVQLEWEVTKEKFDNCDFTEFFASPQFNVKIGKEESKWSIQVYPKGYEEENRNKVRISLENHSKECQVISYRFDVKTLDGYWPTDLDPIKRFYVIQNKLEDRLFKPNGTDSWGYSIGSTEEFSGKFHDDKMTIVATLVIYRKGQEYLEHKKTAAVFIRNSRAIADLEELTDVTLVCQGKRFECHKAVLASRSSFFGTNFTNGNFSDGNAKVINIEDSTSDIVEKMLDFLSSGLIPDDIDETATELIKLSTFYGIDSLTSACEKSLIKSLSSENVIETFIIFDKYLPMSKLRSKIPEFIKENKDEVGASRDWAMFCSNHPNLVVELL